jgi:type I restriction enzyme M protein
VDADDGSLVSSPSLLPREQRQSFMRQEEPVRRHRLGGNRAANGRKVDRQENGTNRALEQLPSSPAKSPKQVFRALRNYLAGQLVGATRDDTLLHELLKCLFCKLYLETAGKEADRKGPDPSTAARFYRGVFRRVRGDFPEIYALREEILLDAPSLVHVMRALRFPLLTAERDPIGDAYEVFAGSESRARSGQFFTPRNAMDFLVRAVDPKPADTIVDPACGAGGFLAAVARHFRRAGHSTAEIAAAASNWHGIEKDSYLARLARLHGSLLTGGHVRVSCADSLSFRTEAGSRLQDSIPVSGYDVLLTNPPFGANIVAAGPETLRTFVLARRWVYDRAAGRWHPTSDVRPQVPPQVLFIERCLSMVREGGRIGMVLPESVLSNRSYRHVVEFLRSQATVNAVVGMPEELFKTSGKGGTHTKTCLLVLTRGVAQGKKASRVFLAEARWCGHDSRAREIPYDDLPSIGDRLDRFQRGKALSPSHLGFSLAGKQIADNVLCPRYYDPELGQELERLRTTHTLIRFGDLVERGCLALATGDEVGKLAYGAGEIPFIRTSDLSNWEIKVDPKHCIDRGLYLTLRDKQDVQPNDILLVKDGTYLIGTCALVTACDREIVYQSHLYKIRIAKEEHGLNPFLLLAILSSPVVQRQIRARQFTQDIIDSLGERIHELLLPVPRSRRLRDRVTAMVRTVIADRMQARELARQASAEVLNGSV